MDAGIEDLVDHHTACCVCVCIYIYMCVYVCVCVCVCVSLQQTLYTHSLGAVLITDATAAMGLPDGNHMLGTMSVELLNGIARLAGKSTLAGR